jgi:hypothetical protein
MAKGKAKVTMNQVLAAVERDDYTGICLACGNEQDGCEPDAREYTCEVCGANKVYGAEEAFLMMIGFERESARG